MSLCQRQHLQESLAKVTLLDTCLHTYLSINAIYSSPEFRVGDVLSYISSVYIHVINA